MIPRAVPGSVAAPGDLPPPSKSESGAAPDQQRAITPGVLGIACAGGGVRSAAFTLGALQALDQAGVLRRSSYLSTVSGSSYTAAAYAIANRYSDPELLAETPSFAPGTPEESWIRNRCSYLSDSFGDTVRLAAEVLVGLLANLVYYSILLWVVARPLGWLYAWWQPGLDAAQACQSGNGSGVDCRFELTGIDRWAGAAGVLVYSGILVALYVRMFQPSPLLARQFGRIGVLLVAVGAWTAAWTVVVPVSLAVLREAVHDRSVSPGGRAPIDFGFALSVGSLAAVVAVLTQVSTVMRDPAVLDAASWARRHLGRILRAVGRGLGAMAVVAALAVGGVVIVVGAIDVAAAHNGPTSVELLLWGLMAVLAVALVLFTDVTSWSLHPFYKRRLMGTFAVVRSRDITGEPFARAVPDAPVPLSAFTPEQFPVESPFPELLVGATVRLSDPGVTPPGAAGRPFVFGPNVVGCPDVVTVRRRASWLRFLFSPVIDDVRIGPLQTLTGRYEAAVGRRRERDITLPAAVAISSAAVAPTITRATSPLRRFLLTMTNVRLGVWLPNPQQTSRPVRIRPANPGGLCLLYETIGKHTVRAPFLYVTDGGFLEDLGLLELLRRQCTTIVCLDATHGFHALGRAQSVAYAELGVNLRIEPPVPPVDSIATPNHVVGEIAYPDGTVGKLVYGTARFTPTSSAAARAYGEMVSLLPGTEPGDRATTGGMFDAYQALGRDVGAACAWALRS